MTSAPFRDQFAFVRQVEQHVGIALALLEQCERVRTALFIGSREIAEFAEASNSRARRGKGIWQQLEQACDLARAAGATSQIRTGLRRCVHRVHLVGGQPGSARTRYCPWQANPGPRSRGRAGPGPVCSGCARRRCARGGTRGAATNRDPSRLACTLVVGVRAVRVVHAGGDGGDGSRSFE